MGTSSTPFLRGRWHRGEFRPQRRLSLWRLAAATGLCGAAPWLTGCQTTAADALPGPPAPAVSAVGAQPEAARKPNFIIIFADDLGYGDLGCFGADKIKTPTLDRMAQNGVRLTDFYVPSSVCSPSRAGLMTGSYPARVGLAANVLFPYSARGMNPNEITIAEVLKSAGYATACIGKWHLGHLPQFLPTKQGFDYYYGIPYSNDMKPSVLMRGEEIIEQPVNQDTLTDRYTAEAIQFIHAHKDAPFFVYLPHNMPHVPLHAPAEARGQSARGLYGDVVERIDWSTGKILDALKADGLERNTYIVFTSDNGPWLTQGINGGSAGPLRDGKTSTYEGGQREPTVVYAPGLLTGGREVHAVTSSMDLLPTFAALAGAKIPTDRTLDGHDISGLLQGRPDSRSPYDAFYYYNVAGKIEAIREGDWKLRIDNPWKAAAGKGKLERGAPELYNLKDDLGEKHNVAADHPETVARLQKKMEAFDAELAAHVRPEGQGEQTPEMKALEAARAKAKGKQHVQPEDEDHTD